MCKFMRTTALFVLIIFFLLPQSVYADGQPASITFKNADKVSIFYEENGFKSLEFVIYNNKTTPINLTYRIETPEDKEGHHLQLKDLLEEKILAEGSEPVTLAGALSQSFTISFKQGFEPLYEGTYTSKLIVSDLSNDQVISKELEFIFPKPAESFTPKPLKKEWTARVERWLLWNNTWLRTTQNCLPLDVDYQKILAAEDPAKSLGLTQGAAKPLGVLFGEDGEMIQVFWTGEIKKLPDGKTGIVLEFLGLKKIGEYSGTLTLFEDKDKKEGDVSLTLNYSTNIFWPILLISLGILLAVWAGAYSNSMRKIMLLRKDIYELPGLFEQAHKKYLENIKNENKDVINEPYTRYTIQPEIMEFIGSAQKPASLIYRVLELEKNNRFSLSDENQVYKEINSDIKKVKDHIESWPLFGTNLAKLDSELEKFKKIIPALDPALYFKKIEGYVFPDLPKVLGDLETPLKEENRINFDILILLTAKTKEARALIKTWQETESILREDYKYINKIEQDKEWKNFSDEDKKMFGEIANGYGAAAYSLWYEEKIDNLTKILDTVQVKIKQPFLKDIILDHPLSGKDKESRELWIPEQKTWSDITDTIYALLGRAREEKEEEPSSYALEVSRINTRMWVFDIILIFLAFVFALAAGLESEVIGKNFGTVWDVIKLLTLGLASKLTLDTLDKALGVLKPKEG